MVVVGMRGWGAFIGVSSGGRAGVEEGCWLRRQEGYRGQQRPLGPRPGTAALPNTLSRVSTVE